MLLQEACRQSGEVIILLFSPRLRSCLLDWVPVLKLRLLFSEGHKKHGEAGPMLSMVAAQSIPSFLRHWNTGRAFGFEAEGVAAAIGLICGDYFRVSPGIK